MRNRSQLLRVSFLLGHSRAEKIHHECVSGVETKKKMSKTKLPGSITVLVVLMLVLASCDTPAATGADQVEVFSWWTSGDEAAGLQALTKVLQENYPNTKFINAAVSNESAMDAHAQLAARLKAGKPPDSWQGHSGQELIGAYVAAKQIEPLNSLYKGEGWLNVMPTLMFPLISQNGSIYSVPVSIHRVNVLWYNPKILKDNGIAVPTNMDEWFVAMDALKAADVTPLAIGEPWTKMLLMETILLSTLGPDKYNGLWDGSTNWTGDDVKAALENFQKALTYTNGDSGALSWQDAAGIVVKGDAAFLVMPDWVESYFRKLGDQPNTDYGWTPVPGSAGVFQFLADSFVLATGAPHQEAALQWLKVAGSKEGQEAFNSANGSICARTDCDKSLFDAYLQSAMDDWSNNTLVGSLAFGVVANDAWKSKIDTALGLFVQDENLGTFQSALADACKSAGSCK